MLDQGEQMRVFPLSNWAELDIWLYKHQQDINIVPIYLAFERMSWVDEDSGQTMARDDDRMLPYLSDVEKKSLKKRMIRFRTRGCHPQTGTVESTATTNLDIVAEMLSARTSERESRLQDKGQSDSMKKRIRRATLDHNKIEIGQS